MKPGWSKRSWFKARLLFGLCLLAISFGCTREETPPSGVERWDLNRPGFEQAKNLFEAGDIEGARRSIVSYYADREGPWPVTPDQIREKFRNAEIVLAKANEHLAYRFSHVNDTIQLEPPIDWETNPSTNQEWIWAFNRHYEWKTLSRAYILSGEEKYARFLQDQAHNWITRNRPLPEKDESSPTWRLIDVGLRMSESWIYAFGLIRDSEHVSWQVKWEMLQSIHDHACFLASWPTSQNHLLMESMGLASVVAYFPEFKESEKWGKIAFNRLDIEATRQVFPDGVHYECSTHYQWTVADVLENSRHLAELAGEQVVFERLSKTLKEMYRFLAFAMRPDGYPPLINDGVQRDIRGLLNRAADRYGKDIYRYAATQGDEGKRPLRKSQSFPFGGFTILRTGFVPNSAFLFFDYGPLGGYHGHEDFLNFEFYAFGSPLIIDPGTFTYNRSDPFRSFFLSSAAHNLVLVNGYGQARRFNKVDPADLEHILAVFDRKFSTFVELVTACYNGPYGTEEKVEYECIRHRRIILFVRPILVVIADFVSSPELSTFTQLFHLDPTLVETYIDPVSQECFATAPTVSLRIIPLGNDGQISSQLLCGEEQPLQGWFSPDYNTLEPAPVVQYEQHNRCDAAFYTVLAPAKGKYPRTMSVEMLPLSVEGKPVSTGLGVALKIVEGDRTDYYIITNMLEGRKTAGELTTEDHVSLLRLRNGQLVDKPFRWSLAGKKPEQTPPRSTRPKGNVSIATGSPGFDILLRTAR